jgi:hypothetical protein
MKSNSIFLSSFVLVIMLALGSCARKPDDAKMSSEIQTKFSQDSGLSAKQLTVQANNGVVTLSGSVDNVAQRDAAGKHAASVPGVKTVVNNLQVGDDSASVAAAAKPTAAPQPSMAPHADRPLPAASKSKKTRARKKSGSGADSGLDASEQTMSGTDQPAADSKQQPSTSQNTLAVATEPPPPPAPKKLIIDQGTQLTVRLVDPIDSEKNQTGDTFHATLNAPLTSDGEEAVPAGVELTGHLVEVKSAGKFAGQSGIAMQLDKISSGGKTYEIQTDEYKKQGSSRGKNTAEKVGGGAVIGSIIGAIAGGGKGAAIGAAAGAGVGGGVQAATKGQQIKLPSETVLNFTLQAPITVIKTQSPDPSRQKLNESQ